MNINLSLMRFSLQKVSLFSMCTKASEAASTKSYRMPQAKEIQLYKTQFPIRMHNYRVLLFANKQNLSTPMMLQTPIAGMFLIFVYLIRNNPWYLTFPASLPIMMGAEFYLFYKWIFHKRHYKYIIERVYLEDGNSVEFTFSNKIRRKLKNTQNSHLFSDPVQLITPDQGKDGAEWTQKGFPFPKQLKYKRNQNTGEIECVPPMTPTFYGWTKYCSNFQNYIFPKYYEYANWQILVPLLNGRYMDFQNSTNEVNQLSMGQNYPSIEQEFEWIKQDQKLNDELRIQRQKQRLPNFNKKQ